ncbi:MAG: alpha amylase C-terminal domain-containing protein [Verrucomicrobiae bacterium]|nr:alpha amylase C-terminal domain-containing protein [Verrucomicrobiae bacterium]
MQLVKDDPWLEPYNDAIRARRDRFVERLEQVTHQCGSLEQFAACHEQLGVHYDAAARGWRYREWAPRAEQLWLIGDFNHWDRESHPLIRRDDGSGEWEIFLPDAPDGSQLLAHGQLLKVRVKGSNGVWDRIPPYIRRAVQDDFTADFAGQIWQPERAFPWTDAGFSPQSVGSPLIYECHIGMAQEKEGVGTYSEFRELILPRIARLGYNVIQIMAIQEHPYYGSFGYHVSNLFAPSSRFGTPEELKQLIDAAHSMGIAVLLDIVHSHAVKNFAEGLSEFDGEDGQYFHTGGRGSHPGWDSRLFDYGKPEVQRFLLSNLRYWIEDFHFDGFRFDGVTSMLYWHHGEGVAFDHYDKYFHEGVETDAVTYLQMATELAHRLKPGAIVIAEDMSGMPGLCRPIDDGGLGFDFRLAMGIPDYWIKLLKHTPDEDWDIHALYDTLTNRRYGEATIAYAESHDQALVGDKSLAFWLMDQEMYWNMAKSTQSIVIDRGIALHKMLRLITIALGGDGYLNFIGNEFGHPEWVDFPREGNHWSYTYARRQWSLVDNPELRYEQLNAFDVAMIGLVKDSGILKEPFIQQVHMDPVNHVIIFRRGPLLFIFNFHPDKSIPDYQFRAPESGEWKICLSSDDRAFGGFDRVDTNSTCTTLATVMPGDTSSSPVLRVYIPNRTALVLELATD